MKPFRPVTFQRFNAHIQSERRTLFHVPVNHQTWAIGHGLILLCSTATDNRYKLGVVTDARQVRLIAELDADLIKLDTGRTTYLAAWDAIHTALPSDGDPLVWRIEFRYGTPPMDPTDAPEWSLAS